MRSMRSPLRLAVAAAAVGGLAPFVLPVGGSAQQQPESMTSASQPPGWEVSFSPRVGYFLPQRGSGGQDAVRRPTFGAELVARRTGSWFGARALFERSATWSGQRGILSSVLPGGSTILDTAEGSLFFETVVVDAMAYTPAYDGVRAYMFTGYGSKIIGSPDDAPALLPYALVGGDRAPTWHAGFGIEAPLGRGAGLFEVGDYYGRNGGPNRVHDLHLTVMARVPGVADLITSLIKGEDSDG